MRTVFQTILTLLLFILLCACAKGGETALSGTILFQDQPLAGAGVEIYLKEGKDRATLPFATTSADAAGVSLMTLHL